MNEIKKILISAKELLEQGWCQNAYAKDAAETACDPLSPEATSWCIRGALRKVCNIAGKGRENPHWTEALAYLGENASTPMLADWNDDPKRAKNEVLALFNRAIKNA